uniref:ATP-dependent DNA helicase n=1 Tax=Moniliophthora roreri TaxID=221103 RepID=A0A0W0FY27_MONRR
MSSDDYYDTDPDEAVLGELDAIEAAHASPPKNSKKRRIVSKEDSFFDDSFDFDERELENLDKAIAEAYQSQPAIQAPVSKSSSRVTLQTTLIGEVLPAEASGSSRSFQRTTSRQQNKPPNTKRWDHTEFAKSGWRKPKRKGKSKADDEDGELEDEIPEFEQFPVPFVPAGYVVLVYLHYPLFTTSLSLPCYRPPPPMKLKPDLLEAKHWIYPLNQPKRDYQFNIVKHALFNNTIVALPTGMGKTFVAGVIMLNFYRWFPEGKVVFVAPTKPLVAQQIEACHRTCGIPGSDAAELTGGVAKGMRNKLWGTKRIFYMTPQTLMNDLITENCEVRDIILLVIDEAHRASGGDYAYNQVIRFMMAKNPHFRVLALTATPGSTPDAVQNLVDGLHVNRIEIRDENSLDLKPYIHEKAVEQHIIPMSRDVIAIRDHLLKVMDHFSKSLISSGVIHQVNLQRIHPYFFQHKANELKPAQKWAYGHLFKLATLSRIMAYLVEGTTGMCYTAVQKLVAEAKAEEGSKQKANKAVAITTLPAFKSAMDELEMQKRRGFANHPKMEKMLRLIIDYFGQKLPEPGVDEQTDQSKAMVFVTNREAVEEIVQAMDAHRPLLRASRFIGQGTDVRGQKGLAQREQLEVINKFKTGEFNVLVATSIGEEGLDIGEVDLIICYDAQKTPIRMLQRLGRTGRKRAGIVHVLLAEDREEQNFEKAKLQYKEVQKSIVRGDQLIFYDDVERLLPDHVHPQCVEKCMEIQEYVREPTGRSKSIGNGTTGVKRKRNDDIGRNIPAGASTGFVSVSDLLNKGKSKKPKPNASRSTLRDFDDAAGEDDDTDRELESGVITASTSRLKKSSSTAASSSKGKTRLRKSRTVPAEGSKKSKPKKAKEKEDLQALTSSQFNKRGLDDNDDDEIERGFDLPKSSPPSFGGLARAGSSECAIVDGGVLDITSDSEIDIPLDKTHKSKSPRKRSQEKRFIDLSNSGAEVALAPSPHSPSSSKLPDNSVAWLIDDDDDVSFRIIDSSPVANRPKSRADVDNSVEFVENSPSSSGRTAIRTADDAFYDGDSMEIILPSPVKGKGKAKVSVSWDADPPPSQLSMPPPQLPSARFVSASSLLSSCSPPEPSFAVRPAGKAKKPVIIGDSPISESSVIPRRRIRRRFDDEPESESPKPKKKKPRKSLVPPKDNRWYDFEATHSGDETSQGSSDDDNEDPESDSDRQFLEELPETQVSSSYDQTLVYRNSLMTQAPNGANGPVFSKKPLRRAPFGRGMMSNKRRPGVSSSPPREEDDEVDEYEFGSFVVDDDAEISYEM